MTRWPGLAAGAVLALTLLSACRLVNRDPTDPRTLPDRFEKVEEFAGRYQCVDLDRDGRDEFIQVQPTASRPTGSALVLYTHDFNTVDQVNFAGRLVPLLQFLDIDGDGQLEIAAPWVRNDSLFLTFVNSEGMKLHTLFLTRGRPRIEEEGVVAQWDPSLRACYLIDLDEDGRRELVSVVNTALARLPRGVLVHAFPDGRLLGEKIVGASLVRTFLDDYDHDGRPELIVDTVAPRNFARFGGFDDEHAYFLVFELTPKPAIEWWQQTGGFWSETRLFYADFNRDGRKEFLTFTWTHSEHPDKAQLELLEPGTWRTIRKKALAEPFKVPVGLDLNHDAVPEIVAIRAGEGLRDEIWVFNGALERIARQVYPFNIQTLTVLPDLDGDGTDELAVSSAKELFLLKPTLEVRAVVPVPGSVDVFQRGLGHPPYLMTSFGTVSGPEIVLWRLQPNRAYLWYRYRNLVGVFAGAGLAFALVLAGTGVTRRYRLLQAMQQLALDTDSRGLLLLSPDLRLQSANERARTWFDLPGQKALRKLPLEQAVPPAELRAFFARLRVPPPHRREQEVVLRIGSYRRPFKVTAEPIWQLRRSGPHWLVLLEDLSAAGELHRAKAWSAMAQRIAHDIKNPLTSIQLTLQRLQMEYRDRTPDHAERFDSYSNRIVERIEALRKMSRGFMKFLSLEEIKPEPTDLNAFIRELFEHKKLAVPQDIRLCTELTDALPVVNVDQEQMHTLLDNLVSNAVEAMPDGGMLSIRTALASNLQIQQKGTEPRDYVTLEVMDTGRGIAPEFMEKLFQPFVSGRTSGTGLGLTIVKKIVEDHGGYIEVNSEEGTGTSFLVYLPVA